MNINGIIDKNVLALIYCQEESWLDDKFMQTYAYKRFTRIWLIAFENVYKKSSQWIFIRIRSGQTGNDAQNVILVGNDKIWLNLDQSYNIDAMNPRNNRLPGDCKLRP